MRRQPVVSSPPSSTKKKTPLVLEDTGGKQAVQVKLFHIKHSNVTFLQRGPSPSPSSASSCTTGTDLSSLLSLSRLSSLSSQRSLSSWLSNPIQSSSFCRSRSITDFSSLDRWLKNDVPYSYLSGMCQSCWLFPRISPLIVLPSCLLRLFFNSSALQFSVKS